MTATNTTTRPKIYMSEREIKRIFNLPRQASDALDKWKNKNLENKGTKHDDTEHGDAE